GDVPADDARAPPRARGAAPEALAPVTPTVASATPAAAATNACVMYLCIPKPPWFPPVAARRSCLKPPARAYPHPRVLAHRAGVPLVGLSLMPGAAQLWARPGRGVKSTAGAARPMHGVASTWEA